MTTEQLELSRQLGQQIDTNEPPKEQSLLQIVNTLEQLFELAEDAPTEEDEAVIRGEIQRIFVTEAAKKIDGVGFFCKRIDAEIELRKGMIDEIDASIKKLEYRKAWMRAIVQTALRALPEPKLKGKIHRCYLSPGRDSLEVFDEKQVPLTFKSACVEMRADVWELVRKLPVTINGETTPVEKNVRNCSVTYKGDLIRKALADKQDVPGARMKAGDEILTIR